MRELLAQVNVARQRAELGDPVMAGFEVLLERMGRLAARSQGFVWALDGGGLHGATSIRDGEDLYIVNLSVWRDYETLHRFVYRTMHGQVLARRTQWFLPTQQPSTALWWIGEDERPDLETALRRLQHLRTHGPTPQAFGLRRRFTPDGKPVPRGPAAGSA